MALTEEQIAARRQGIGASDALMIMSPEPDAWFRLWKDKRGIEPITISLSPWDELLRHAIEPAILDWYEVKHERPVTERGVAVISGPYPMLRCTLDGADRAVPRVIDAKLLSAFTPDALGWAAEHYAWQMLHQMICTEIPNAWLYISVGMKEPVPVEIDYEDFLAAQYIDRAREFWSYVESGKEPPGAPPPPAPPVPKELMRVVDMTGSNEWGAFAADWLANQAAAKAFEAAGKGIKGLVERDVRLATGHGIAATRDGRGVTIKQGGAA